jgi:hypothetical protein
MRVQRLLAQGGANAVADAQQQQSWANYLQRIREGTEKVFPEVGEEVVLIPEDMCCQGDVRIYCTPSLLRYALTIKDRLEVELLCSVV